MNRFAAVLAIALLAGCPPHVASPSGTTDATVAAVETKLTAQRDARKGFTGESVMDYWLGKNRVKTSVYAMGEVGAKVRFNGLSPAGGSVLLDLACDGTGFKLVDSQNNCTLSGVCDRNSIAQLLHIQLAPDDFLHLALGTPPPLANPTGSVTWDAANGLERVEMTGPEGTQKLAIDTRDGHWDVVSSELVGSDGKTVWAVDNSDFQDVDDDATHGKQRVPGKSRFKSPGQDADVLVEWKQLKVNPTIDDAKFAVVVPAGLPTCQQQAPQP
jgi:hypothetical protein